MQLVKLRSGLGRIRRFGAEVLAISTDRGDDARAMAAELGPDIRVLSDPGREVIYAYNMKEPGSTTADMGYVLIDSAGRVRTQQIDHALGDHAGEIVNELERMAGAGARPR